MVFPVKVLLEAAIAGSDPSIYAKFFAALKGYDAAILITYMHEDPKEGTTLLVKGFTQVEALADAAATCLTGEEACRREAVRCIVGHFRAAGQA